MRTAQKCTEVQQGLVVEVNERGEGGCISSWRQKTLGPSPHTSPSSHSLPSRMVTSSLLAAGAILATLAQAGPLHSPARIIPRGEENVDSSNDTPSAPTYNASVPDYNYTRGWTNNWRLDRKWRATISSTATGSGRRLMTPLKAVSTTPTWSLPAPTASHGLRTRVGSVWLATLATRSTRATLLSADATLFALRRTALGRT